MKQNDVQKIMSEKRYGAKDLAEIFGVTPQAVLLWVTGQRRIPKIVVKIIRLEMTTSPGILGEIKAVRIDH